MKPKYFYIRDLTQFDMNEWPSISNSMISFYSKIIRKNDVQQSYCKYKNTYGNEINLGRYYFLPKWLKPVTKKNFYTIAKECRNEIQELSRIADDLGLVYPEKIEVSDGSSL